jgi:hypothetical protein
MANHRAHLADLDELALLVRETTSRAYILEAIADYRAGSYRSAIVATWTAICFDIVAKFRELSTSGDAAARNIVSIVDQAIAQPKNPEKFLAIEKELLDHAGTAGFIGHREQLDLERVKEDRNYCAHPAFIADAALFQPTPDQCRAHIVHAVDHLLQHPPVEGKTAIDRFKREIEGTAFPPSDAAVEAWLKARYSGHVKAATLRSLIVMATKGALRVAAPNLRQRALAVLRVMRRIEHHAYADALKDQLPKLLASTDGRILPRLAVLLAQDQSVVSWVGGDVIARLQGAMSELPVDDAENRGLFALADLPEFRGHAKARFASLDAAEKAAVLSEYPARSFVSEVIADYAASSSYRGAEARGERVVSLSTKLQAPEIAEVLKAAVENNEIWDAAGTPEILTRLFDHTEHLLAETSAAWVEFLRDVYDKKTWMGTAMKHVSDKLAARGIAVPEAPLEE